MTRGFSNFFGVTINPMGIFFTLIILAICYFFYKGQKTDNRFNIWDAFMADGKTSSLSIIFFGSWVAMTWVLINKEMKNTLDISFYNFYALTFVAPVITRLVTGAAKAFSGKDTP